MVWKRRCGNGKPWLVLNLLEQFVIPRFRIIGLPSSRMRYMHLYDYMTVCNVISILPSLLERCSYTVTEHAFWSSFVFVAPCSGTLLFSFSWFFLGAKTIQSFWLQMNMSHLDPFGTGVAVVHMTCSGWNDVESALLFHFFPMLPWMWRKE